MKTWQFIIISFWLTFIAVQIWIICDEDTLMTYLLIFTLLVALIAEAVIEDVFPPED